MKMKNEANLKKETDITRRGRLAHLCRKADNDAWSFAEFASYPRMVRRRVRRQSRPAPLGCRGSSAAPSASATVS